MKIISKWKFYIFSTVFNCLKIVYIFVVMVTNGNLQPRKKKNLMDK